MLTAAQPAAVTAREARLTSGPVLPVLATLALPNVLAMVAAAAASIAETVYVGILGRESLAAMAVVFPFAMLMQTFSAGAMGGAISSAISRALGASDIGKAHALALHATLISFAAALLFTLFFLLLGPSLYRLLGARDEVLNLAVAYSVALFSGIAMLWLANTFISILRGTGDMRVPSIALLATAGGQVILGATLGLGLGPFPTWGITGVALAQVFAYGTASLFLFFYLRSTLPRVRLGWRGIALQKELFMQILRVGLLASLSPLQTVLTILVMTGLIARLGVDALAGYGIGARLEFLLIPIAFGIGVATVPMVGMAIGRKDLQRARRVAWTGAALSAGIVGMVGILVALWPQLWIRMFTSQPGVVDYAELYFRHAGPGYAFFGLGLTLFFASQGAGKVLGPVIGATLRLVMVAVGGFWLAAIDAPAWAFFALVAVAMTMYGLFTIVAVMRTNWLPDTSGLNAGKSTRKA
jgi:putative MATE family efflux protein